MTTVSRRCSVLQTVKPVLSGQLMGKSKQLKFHKIKIKPITFDLYLPTFRANSPKELTRSVFTVFFKKRSGVMSFKTYQRLENKLTWGKRQSNDTSMRTVFSFREIALDNHFPVSEKTNQNKTRQSIPSFNVHLFNLFFVLFSNTYQ